MGYLGKGMCWQRNPNHLETFPCRIITLLKNSTFFLAKKHKAGPVAGFMP